MPTHVALLRGINVGGGGKVPMADLRDLLTKLGHSDVKTYIQTGNIVFTPPHDDTGKLAAEIRDAIKSTFGVSTFAVVLTKAELAAAIAANPYPDEPNPKWVHGVFLVDDPRQAQHDRVADAVAAASDRGSRDEAKIVGKILYLHTPDGFGTSELAKDLLMKNRRDPLANGTARNWSTISKLLALSEDAD
jgi:uncharacterized protein (DUF1697 family)